MELNACAYGADWPEQGEARPLTSTLCPGGCWGWPWASGVSPSSGPEPTAWIPALLLLFLQRAYLWGFITRVAILPEMYPCVCHSAVSPLSAVGFFSLLLLPSHHGQTWPSAL